jgi:hypothetical protein
MSFWVKGVGKPPPGKGVYIVQRLSWALGGDESGPSCYRDDGDQGTPLCCFRSRKQAEAYCRELEQQARRELSPFQFGEELELLTSLKKPALDRGLRQLGLKPPTAKAFRAEWGGIDWRAWWDAVAADLTDAQREGIFDLLDRLRFYEVTQAEFDPS